ncbi:S41 family peptidase [Gilvimarinus sp. DA14]|uniref:S41 family peptidase n=1 Tax=Gilvimarinus sp. DA14 TaxID=2956798 RepID=UPI0020B838C4|nr:S41 family peptidase [Gilvimarinus sp. DA14]UTF61536.1 S41 family peptidase [Gilvimarinus sp. DA14]
MDTDLAEAPFCFKLAARELNYLDHFFRLNDAGAISHLQQRGEACFEQSLQRTMGALRAAGSWRECAELYSEHLQQYRRNHLGIEPLHAEPPPESHNNECRSLAPSFEQLSTSCVLLRLQSFEPQYAQPLQQLLEQHRHSLEASPHWIIDMRHNEGGSDWSYASLLPWLVRREVVSIGVQWRATRANIDGLQRLLAEINAHSEPHSAGDAADYIGEVIAAMQGQPGGEFVSTWPEPYSLNQIESEVPGPRQVAILIGPHCYSAGEQFLLTVRQSFKVKLIGQPTAGALDYSNLVSHTLPESGMKLWYATSRSARLPHYPVDSCGVLPDIYLPLSTTEAKHDQILRVQRWLEGGSLAL